MRPPQDKQEGRGKTIAYAALGLLFTLALSTSIWAQGQSEERAYVYIGRAMAATYLAIIVLAWAKQPFPRVVIRVICGVAAVLAGLALIILIATGKVASSSWSIYGGGPIWLLLFVIAGTIPSSVQLGKKQRPPAN